MVFSVSDFLSLSLSSWYGILWPKPLRLGSWVGCMGCVWVWCGPGETEPSQDVTCLAHAVHLAFPVLLKVNTLPVPLHGHQPSGRAQLGLQGSGALERQDTSPVVNWSPKLALSSS